MIRVVKQKSADIRCTFMQIILLLAMMLCLVKPQSKEQVGKPASQHVVYERNQDPFTGYISSETRF